MFPHHSDQMSQSSKVSNIALWRCSLNVYVIVFVIVIVIVVVFVVVFLLVRSCFLIALIKWPPFVHLIKIFWYLIWLHLRWNCQLRMGVKRTWTIQPCCNTSTRTGTTMEGGLIPSVTFHSIDLFCHHLNHFRKSCWESEDRTERRSFWNSCRSQATWTGNGGSLWSKSESPWGKGFESGSQLGQVVFRF